MTTRPGTLAAPVLRVELGCDFNQVRPVAERVQSFLREQGCAEAARVDCELVLVEGCNNAIKHSQPLAAQQTIVVEAVVDPEQIELRITDYGPGFTWPETTHLPDPEEESGRGLYLMRRLTDYAAYFRRAKCNVLVLRKKR
jgi:anti-sigma regulatory factor (Ser/Thr protein kinase)